jgi:hypothetical protein
VVQGTDEPPSYVDYCHVDGPRCWEAEGEAHAPGRRVRKARANAKSCGAGCWLARVGRGGYGPIPEAMQAIVAAIEVSEQDLIAAVSVNIK